MEFYINYIKFRNQTDSLIIECYMSNNYLLLKVLFVLLSLSFCSKKGFCQKGYIAGYIVSQANDTLETKISYSDLEKNRCVYLDHSGTIKIGNPETVKAFAILSGRKFRYIRFDNKKDTIDAYFEILVEGKIDLFSYQKRFFVKKGNDKPRELLSSVKDVSSAGGATFTKNKKEYIGLLKFLLSDATISVPNIEAIDLSKKDLIKTIRIYNEGESYIQELNRLRYKPNCKIGVEALFSSDNYRFRFPSDSFTDEYDGGFFLPGVGGVIKYQFTKHLSVNSGVRLRYLNYSIYKSYGPEYSTRFYTIKDDFFVLSVPLIFDHQFNNLFFHPCIGLGVQFEKNLLKNTLCLEESNLYSAPNFYTYERQTNFSNPINSYLAIELGGSENIGKLLLNLKAQYLINNSDFDSVMDNQFYHRSGFQLSFGVLF